MDESLEQASTSIVILVQMMLMTISLPWACWGWGKCWWWEQQEWQQHNLEVHVFPKPEQAIQCAKALAAMCQYAPSFQPNPHVLTNLYDDEWTLTEEMVAFCAAFPNCLFEHMHAQIFAEQALHRSETKVHCFIANFQQGAINICKASSQLEHLIVELNQNML
jgi:hypothetical protein